MSREYTDAKEWANKAMIYSQQERSELRMILAARLQGEAALGLDDIVTAEERLHHALARARDAGAVAAAVKAATMAYRLAWCDGPPFAYHWGLQKAKVHLAVLLGAIHFHLRF